MNKNAPIGIFDSGIGGLTVAHAIKDELPKENLIYFGDTAHLPYGDKSTATVQAYAVKITDFLISKNCKTVVIACNSASSAANDLLTEYVASKATIINVIDPMVSHIANTFINKKIGIIGTKQTIYSSIYPDLIKKANQSISVKSLATPLLVPMIEEGFLHNKIAHDIIDKYLGNNELEKIEALVLACTHYPLIKTEIDDYFDKKVEILDSSVITAKYLKQFLGENDLLNTSESKGYHQFYVSDLTDSFEYSAMLFFGNPVVLEKYKLWE